MRIKAFTLLEGLVTLTIVALLLSFGIGSGHMIFTGLEERLFFLSFEDYYRKTQLMSVIKQEETALKIKSGSVSSVMGQLPFPKSITVDDEVTVTFDHKGGNSSLQTIHFQTSQGSVDYQLYLGSGRYKRKD